MHFCTTKRSVLNTLSNVERVVCQIYSTAFSVKGLISPCRNWHKIQNRALQQGSEILEGTAFFRSFTGKERNLFLGRFLESVLSVTSFRVDPILMTPSLQTYILVRSCLSLLLLRKTVLNLPHSLLMSSPPNCYFCCHSLILKSAFICNHLKTGFKSCQRQDFNSMRKIKNLKYFCHRNFNFKEIEEVLQAS